MEKDYAKYGKLIHPNEVLKTEASDKEEDNEE